MRSGLQARADALVSTACDALKLYNIMHLSFNNTLDILQKSHPSYYRNFWKPCDSNTDSTSGPNQVTLQQRRYISSLALALFMITRRQK